MGNKPNFALTNFMQTLDPRLKKIVIQDSVNPSTITYICLAFPGTPKTSANGWSIIRINSVSVNPPTEDDFEFPRIVSTSPSSESGDFIFGPITQANLQSYTYGAG